MLEREKRITILPLSSSQAYVAQCILNQLKKPPVKQSMLIVEGLSGLGKDFVIETLRSTIEESNGLIIAPNDIDKKSTEITKHMGHLIIPTIPSQIEEVQIHIWDVNDTIESNLITMQGMNEQEMQAYIEQIKSSISQRPSLETEEVIQYSMGVPLLAQKMLSSNTTQDIAIKIGLEYLRDIWPRPRLTGDHYDISGWREAVCRSAEKHLKIQPSSEVMHILREHPLTPYHTYDSLLPDILRRYEELKETGIIEASPLFICPETKEIYAKTFRALHIKNPHISIYMPKLAQEDFFALQRSLGYQVKNYDCEKGIRSGMFGVFYRKEIVWFNNGQDHFYPSMTNLSTQSQQNIKRQRCLEVIEPIKKLAQSVFPEITSGNYQFILWTHEHTIQNPAKTGWMVETWAQQRGIPYITQNSVLEIAYSYRPDEKNIKIFTYSDSP